MEPLVSLRLRGQPRSYRPGDTLTCEYQIDGVDPLDVVALECSVLWCTHGKGDEDLGVHAFERLTPADVEGGDLRQLFVLETTLPNSPLSYSGRIIKVRWCARVRLFLRRGREATAEAVFELGPTVVAPPPPA